MPADDDRTARAFYTLLANRQYAPANALLAPAIADSVSSQVWNQAADALFGVSIDAMYFISANFSEADGVSYSDLGYEGQAADMWFRGFIRVGNGQIHGFTADVVDQSLGEINRFAVVGRSTMHYVILLLGLGGIALSLHVARKVWMSQMPLRPLWALVSFGSIGGFTLNWTTGIWWFDPLRLQFLSLNASRSGPFDPWVLTAAIPIGAIVALLVLQRHRFNAPVQNAIQAAEAPRPEMAARRDMA